MSSCASVNTAFVTPESTARIERSARGAPNIVRTSRSVVPHNTSTTPARSASPTTVHTTVPGDSGVPRDRYHDAPFARTCVTLANVSTLLTDVGFDSCPRECPGSGSCDCQPSCGAVANKPCTYGGSQRGNGSLPSMTSSSAFSSPKRYSSGPATMPIERSPTIPACCISVTAAMTRSRSGPKLAFNAMNTSVASSANDAIARPSTT